MKKSNHNLAVIIIVLASVCLSCSILKDKFAAGAPASGFARVAALPPFDPQAPFISAGAVSVRRLAEIDPSVASLASGIEATERAAMKKVISEHGAKIPLKDTVSFAVPARTRAPAAALMMYQGGSGPLPTANDGAVVGMLAGGMKTMLTPADQVGPFNLKHDSTETGSDGTVTHVTAEIGGAADGSTTFAWGLNTTATKNGARVTTDLQMRVEGNDCPNAEGQLQLTVKARFSARSAGAGYTQDITAFVRLTVGDDAEVATTTIDVTQATTRGKNGQETFVESGQTVKYNGSDATSATVSNERVIQKTDNATADDVAEASDSGTSAAYGAAVGAIQAAKSAWQGGRCVKIEATSPGKVELNSTHDIPLKVRHRQDGSEVPSKVDVALSGETSVSPDLIPRSPGNLTYVAPGSPGKTATIKLTATSRRGRAKVDLSATTGDERFRVDGTSNGVRFTGEICKLSKPFNIDAKFPGGKATTTFTPEGPYSGSTKVSGGGAGCTHTGGGNYNLSGADDAPTLTWTTSDKIACPGFGNSRTATFSLPLIPAPDLVCP